MKKTEAQKVWDALKKIYGKEVAAAVVNVVVLDAHRMEYITVVLPGDLKKKEEDNENT